VMGNSIHIVRNASPDPSFGIELPPTATMRYPWAIEDGAEVYWVPLRGTPGPEFKMNINSTVEVAFEQVGTLKRETLIPMLVQLSNGVETALHAFDDCF
ncbi:MAG: hypothetical protein WBD71_01025, partial [Xanthobacteraceae bacterium]